MTQKSRTWKEKGERRVNKVLLELKDNFEILLKIMVSIKTVKTFLTTDILPFLLFKNYLEMRLHKGKHTNTWTHNVVPQILDWSCRCCVPMASTKFRELTEVQTTHYELLIFPIFFLHKINGSKRNSQKMCNLKECYWQILSKGMMTTR